MGDEGIWLCVGYVFWYFVDFVCCVVFDVVGWCVVCVEG